MGELRESKKRETRRRISDVATALFVERGFDSVTVEEIATAAQVSTVTVFNYFGRKEDLFFDRGEEDYAMIREALAERGPRISALEALQSLVHRLVKEKSPLVSFETIPTKFWRTAKESPALRASARELRAKFERALLAMLEEEAGPHEGSTPLPIIAGMLVSAWCVAFTNGLRKRRAGDSAKAARKEFLRGIDAAFDIVRRGVGDRE